MSDVSEFKIERFIESRRRPVQGFWTGFNCDGVKSLGRTRVTRQQMLKAWSKLNVSKQIDQIRGEHENSQREMDKQARIDSTRHLVVGEKAVASQPQSRALHLAQMAIAMSRR